MWMNVMSKVCLSRSGATGVYQLNCTVFVVVPIAFAVVVMLRKTERKTCNRKYMKNISLLKFFARACNNCCIVCATIKKMHENSVFHHCHHYQPPFAKRKGRKEKHFQIWIFIAVIFTIEMYARCRNIFDCICVSALSINSLVNVLLERQFQKNSLLNRVN